jgi:diguanylate cyclase (GGDEF)-like protein
VLNRRGLAERFDAEVARALREQRPLAVVAIDVDHFKRINDEAGHHAGDRALVWLAAVLCEQTRGSDVIARTGGEEFLVVLPGTDLASASEFAERVRRALATEDGPTALTISAGVAAEAVPTTPHALTQAADAALYEAKREGRDRVVYAA